MSQEFVQQVVQQVVQQEVQRLGRRGSHMPQSATAERFAARPGRGTLVQVKAKGGRPSHVTGANE